MNRTYNSEDRVTNVGHWTASHISKIVYERPVSMLICSDLRADRQSGKSGGDPDAGGHEIQREARNPGGGELPRTSKTAERLFWDFLASKSGHFRDLRLVSPVN